MVVDGFTTAFWIAAMMKNQTRLTTMAPMTRISIAIRMGERYCWNFAQP